VIGVLTGIRSAAEMPIAEKVAPQFSFGLRSQSGDTAMVMPLKSEMTNWLAVPSALKTTKARLLPVNLAKACG
jgi:hypothetical protein